MDLQATVTEVRPDGKETFVQGGWLRSDARKLDLDNTTISLPPERIAEASADGAGGGWPNIGTAIMEKAAVTLKLKTTDGEKLKLMMMRGTGPLGGLGGGEDQRSGFEALGAWFAEQAQR